MSSTARILGVILVVLIDTPLLVGHAPAAEKIFFSSNRPTSSPSGTFLIWWMNPDGSGMEAITSGNHEEGEPRLSPDGRTLLFMRINRTVDPVGNCPAIWVRDLITGTETKLTSDRAFSPEWSPDGEWIAFTRGGGGCGPGGLPRIGVMKYPEGTPFWEILPTTQHLGDPTWLPNGKGIVYVEVSPGGAAELRMYPLPGGPGAPGGPSFDLIPGSPASVSVDERSPAYSPDGTKLAWFTDAGVLKIAATDPATGLLTGTSLLAEVPGGFARPAWSPGGNELIFDTPTAYGGTYDIVKLNIDDTNNPSLTPLTFGSSFDIAGSWALVAESDLTPPALSLPGNIVAEATGLAGASVNYVVTAEDAVDGTRPVNCSPPSGATFPLGTTPVYCSSSDLSGNTATGSFTVTVRDTTRPVVSSVAASPNPVAVNASVTLTAEADDTATAIASATYTVDGACPFPSCGMQTTDADGFNQTHENVVATTMFAAAGVYTICVGARDAAGNAAVPDCAFLPVYDPNAGFVTGGGWITSPPGAYIASPSLTGRATLGFVSKYAQGAHVPTGSTQFQFKVADLNFHGDAYEWLVVAGAQARYKGTGTINGAGVYGFMLAAIDGAQPGGGGVDRFRIKIWDKANGDALVYDNQVPSSNCVDTTDNADPCTALGGGSIIIHKP